MGMPNVQKMATTVLDGQHQGKQYKPDRPVTHRLVTHISLVSLTAPFING